MKLTLENLALADRANVIKRQLDAGARLGLVTSLDGSQLITLLLHPISGTATIYESKLNGSTSYPSLTARIPQAHWFERTTWDMFGLYPEGHLRLKRTHLHEPYADMMPPLAVNMPVPKDNRAYSFLSVEGEGIYEIPVGPIHAGIIEPGHFRFSCNGEQIINLEIRLGYVHRGIEKRLTEIPWQKARFVAEAAASDMPVANAVAHAIAMESLLSLVPSDSDRRIRHIALEVERVAMHLADLSGIAGDIGFLSVSSSFSRLRGIALRMGELLSGNRFMRALICPGGVSRNLNRTAQEELPVLINGLRSEFCEVAQFLFSNGDALERMTNIGIVSQSLANDFGLVGIAARASGIEYDSRWSYVESEFRQREKSPVVEQRGDVLARAKVRHGEILASLEFLEQEIAGNVFPEAVKLPPSPLKLPLDELACGIVESHRGELIHLIKTDSTGKIQRYCLKDPSVNNWTALAIAIRNNLVADFPLCNKSFSLSYSGHDL